MKSIYVVCDKDGNPFFPDLKGRDVYMRVWGFKHKEEAAEGLNPNETLVEYRPMKDKK